MRLNCGLSFKKSSPLFFLSVGVKKSVCARHAETRLYQWRECVPSAALTAASALVPMPPTHCSPAPLSHHARDPTGGHFIHVSLCQNDTTSMQLLHVVTN